MYLCPILSNKTDAIDFHSWVPIQGLGIVTRRIEVRSKNEKHKNVLNLFSKSVISLELQFSEKRKNVEYASCLYPKVWRLSYKHLFVATLALFYLITPTIGSSVALCSFWAFLTSLALPTPWTCSVMSEFAYFK